MLEVTLSPTQNLLETIITDRHRLSSTVLFYSVPWPFNTVGYDVPLMLVFYAHVKTFMWVHSFVLVEWHIPQGSLHLSV